jgi:hypothetical protein
MEQSHSWETNNHLNHDILNLLWNLKVHYQAHKWTRFSAILSHIPIPISLLFPYLCLDIQSGLFPYSYIRFQLYAY